MTELLVVLWMMVVLQSATILLNVGFFLFFWEAVRKRTEPIIIGVRGNKK